MRGKGVSTQRAKRLPRHLRPGWMKRMDQRLRIVKEMNARLAGVGSDLGGLEHLSTIERSLVERLIHVDALASQMEDRVRNGKDFDLAQYLAVSDRVLRIGMALGLQRRAKPVPRALEYAAMLTSNGQEASS